MKMKLNLLRMCWAIIIQSGSVIDLKGNNIALNVFYALLSIHSEEMIQTFPKQHCS